jgi:Zn-dependent protease with chaperone function
MALPSIWRPAVLLSDTLLTEMPVAEISAVFAHEVAHLEHYNRRRLLVSQAASVALAAALVYLAAWDAPGSMLWMLLFPVLIGVTLAVRLSKNKKHELGCDRRAVELCGDADAVCSALKRLHQLSFLPLRLSSTDERASTHPSLIHRIEAIAQVAPAPRSKPTGPTILSGARTGEAVVLESDRGHWLEGISSATQLDPDRLHRQAARVRSIAYTELAELWVEAKPNHRAMLVAKDRSGTTWSMELAEDQVAGAQAALETVALKFAAPAGSRAPAGRRRRARWLIAVAMLVSWATLGWMEMILELGAFMFPHPVVLLASGVALVTRTAFMGADFALDQEAPIASWVLGLGALLGAGLAAEALRIRATEPAARGRAIRGTTALLLTLIALSIAALLAASFLGPWAIRAYQEDETPPFAVSGLVALAAVLALHPRPRWRWSAVLPGLLALMVARVYPSLLSASLHDPLQARAPPTCELPISASRVVREPLGFRAQGLRVSQRGQAFAVGRQPPWSQASQSFLAGRFGGERRVVRGVELAFISEDELLVLGPAESGYSLRLERLGDGGGMESWRQPIPVIEQAQISADPQARTWCVWGQDRDSDQLVRVLGSVGADRAAETRWPLPDGFDQSRVDCAVTGGPTALCYGWAMPGDGTGIHGIFDLLGNLKFEVWLLKPAGNRLLVESVVVPDCLPQPNIEQPLYCLISSDDTTLWSFTIVGARRPVVRLPVRAWSGAAGADGRLALRSDDGVMIVNPSTGEHQLLPTPASEQVTDLALGLEVMALATVTEEPNSDTTVHLYRMTRARGLSDE